MSNDTFEVFDENRVQKFGLFIQSISYAVTVTMMTHTLLYSGIRK